MEKKIKWLSVLLVAQLAAVAVVGLRGSGMGGGQAGGPLLEFPVEAVDKIDLAGSDNKTVTLARIDGRWTLPSLDGLAVASSQVDNLLTKLSTLETGAPVATSDEARQRFEVAEDAYQRRITLRSGDSELAALYLGTGAGRGASHVRPDERDAILVADLAAYNVPLSAEEWLDKTLLQVPEENIEAIEFTDLKLVQSDAEGASIEDNNANQMTKWAVTPASEEGKDIDQAAVKKLVSLVSNLRVDGAAEKKSSADNADQKAELLSFTVVKTNGDPVRYRLTKAETGEDFLLNVSSHQHQFRLTQWQGENLINATRREALLAASKGKASSGTAWAEDTQDKKVEAVDSTDGDSGAAPAVSGKPADPKN